MNGQRILVIAEKPALGRDIADAIAAPYTKREGYLASPDIDVTWGFGHLLGLVDAHVYDPRYAKWALQDLPALPQTFRKDVNREVDRRTGKRKKNADPGALRQINVIRQLLKGATCVIHAGDPDREGQLIVDEILQYLGWRGPTRRLWLNAQTMPGIRSAYKAMKDNDAWLNLSLAAQSREELDWLVGINGTRGYTEVWRAKGHDGMLVVGRVKSAIIGLVEAREREIETFVRTPFYVIRASVQAVNGAFVASWKRPEHAGPPMFDAEGRLLDRAVAEAIRAKCEGQAGVVRKADTVKGKRTPPPLLFSLGELQKVANRMGYSPAATLEAVQALYETHKLTTYPRTSCQYAPESIWRDAGRIIAAVKDNFGTSWPFGDKADPSRQSAAFNDSKLDAHFAIMPTTQRADLSKLPQRERVIYNEIVKRFLAQFHGDYVYDATSVEIAVRDEVFEQRGVVPVEPGWRVLYAGAPAVAKAGSADPAAADGQAPLPPLSVGEAVHAQRVTVEDSMTSPPPRFNGATLLDAMEHIDRFATDPALRKTLKACGLGTEATRGPTIAELVAAGLLDEVADGRAKVYVPTPMARAYARVLSPELTKPDFTAQLEDRLADVARGALARTDFDRFAREFVQRMVGQLQDGSVASAMPTPGELPPAVVVKRTRAAKAGTGKGKAAAKASVPAKAGAGASAPRDTAPTAPAVRASATPGAPPTSSAPAPAKPAPAGGGNPFRLNRG